MNTEKITIPPMPKWTAQDSISWAISRIEKVNKTKLDTPSHSNLHLAVLDLQAALRMLQSEQ
jgi:hypothetical protein